MRVLAIDTALAACSAAVLDTEQGGIIASESLPMLRGHAEALMPLIRRIMDEAGTAFRDLDRVVVTTGPGSFTGLRVGIAAARGIALAIDKPAVGVSTLSAYAAPYLADDDNAPVVVAIDARHSHVYLQVFAAGGRTVIGPRLAPLERSSARGGRGAGAHRRLGRATGRRRACRHRRNAAARRRRAARPTSTGWRGWAPRCRKANRRQNRNICAHPTRSRKTPRNCRADDALHRSSVRPSRAHFI